MERRIALKSLVTVAGSLMVLPACDLIHRGPLDLSGKQEKLLAELVETIIPATDTLGGKDLQLPMLIQKIVADCYEPAVKESFVAGLDHLQQMAKEIYGKSFVACGATHRTQLLLQMEQSEEASQKDFYELVKELTILGYTTSEYVLTNFTDFSMAPGHFYGCVPNIAQNTR